MVGTLARTRLRFAAVALAGTGVPVAAVIRWPGEVGFFLIMLAALGVPLALYVVLIRTRVVSIVTGCLLVFAAVGLPVPGYPQFFGGGGAAGGWGYVLLAIPPLCLVIWLMGFIADLVLRMGHRYRERNAPADGAPGAGGVVAGTAARTGRATSAVGRARPPGIVVRYLPAPGDEARQNADPAVIEGEVISGDESSSGRDRIRP